jgi:two-component system response regulator GlrR
MAANADADDASTVPHATHTVPLRSGRIELVDSTGSIRVGTERLSIGRSPRCAIVLDDPSVSKVHAEVQATPRGVRLVDLQSLNGTFIGGTAIVDVYLTRPCEFHCGAKRLRFVPEPTHELHVSAPDRFGGLVGTTPEMIELFAKLKRYAPTTMSILIRGETGTGKELVAHAIHDASPRRGKHFVSVNCAALPDNLLEAELFGYVRGAFTGADRTRDGFFVDAHEGTLFFDEVGEMSPAMQAKLLRVLENHEVRPVGTGRSRKVDVRTVFATHVDLRHAMNRGHFREDLYFRIAEKVVEVPPLRTRLHDLPILVNDLLAELGSAHMQVDEAGLQALMDHTWSGNVRELRSIVRAAVVESEGDRLMVERALAETSTGAKRERPSELYDDAKRDFERRFYTALYIRYDGNLSKVAKAAGKQRNTVRTALSALGLHGDGGSTNKGT